ncbi:MAG: glycosyltransferase family 4 protein, partial [Desulfurococcaceae archaeon]
GKWRNLYVDGKRSIGEGIYFGLKTLIKLNGRFDVIDCQEFPYFSCISSKIRAISSGSKFFITWHEVWGNYWVEYLGKKGYIGKIVEKFVSKITHYAIAVSEKTKNDIINLGVPENRIKVIPNGIDFERIKKIKPSQESSDVIFAGRLIKDKNVAVLIEAIKLLKKDFPDIKCIIIGNGPEKDKLEKLSVSLGLERNVKFLGFLEEYDNVIAYFKSSKVFVLPSAREGFGISALEANACGLPVVTLNHKMNAACELIRNGENGFICELSAEDVADKIIKAFDFRNSEKCIETAKKYDWNYIVDLVESYYEEA